MSVLLLRLNKMIITIFLQLKLTKIIAIKRLNDYNETILTERRALPASIGVVSTRALMRAAFLGTQCRSEVNDFDEVVSRF